MFSYRCRENPGILRQIHDDVVNEPLNLEVRGRAKSPDLASVMQSTKENSRKTDEICENYSQENCKTALNRSVVIFLTKL